MKRKACGAELVDSKQRGKQLMQEPPAGSQASHDQHLPVLVTKPFTSLSSCHRQALAQGIGHANMLFHTVQDTRSLSVAPRVYGQAVCSGFAKLYEQRNHFSDVTLLVGKVEARILSRHLYGDLQASRVKKRPSSAPMGVCVHHRSQTAV
jgi:hypothetical protein